MRRFLLPLVALALVGAALALLFRKPPPHQPQPPTTVEEQPAPAMRTPPERPAPTVPTQVVRIDAGAGAPKFSPGHVVVRGKWGSQPGEFGRRHEHESNPEAPMSVVAAGGKLAIVDQVNRRVERFDATGKLVGTLSMGGDTVQDLAAMNGGRTALLDRLGDRNVQVYDSDGKLANEVTLVGEGVPEGGAVTGVFSDDNGVYVEREHGTVVRIADGSGNSAQQREELPGRPTRDGRMLIAAALADRAQGTVTVTAYDRNSKQPLWQRDIALGAPLLHLILLDSDRAGHVYLGGDTGSESPDPPYQIVDEAIRVVRLGGDGTAMGVLTLPPITAPDENFRPLSVDDDGNVYEMIPTDNGLQVSRYSF